MWGSESIKLDVCSSAMILRRWGMGLEVEHGMEVKVTACPRFCCFFCALAFLDSFYLACTIISEANPPSHLTWYLSFRLTSCNEKLSNMPVASFFAPSFRNEAFLLQTLVSGWGLVDWSWCNLNSETRFKWSPWAQRFQVSLVAEKNTKLMRFNISGGRCRHASFCSWSTRWCCSGKGQASGNAPVLGRAQATSSAGLRRWDEGNGTESSLRVLLAVATIHKIPHPDLAKNRQVSMRARGHGLAAIFLDRRDLKWHVRTPRRTRHP